MSIISINNLTFCYDGSYEDIFSNVSFQISTDWKTGFTGRNGRGKTTFLKLLLGEYEYSGIISHDMDFEYFPYQTSDNQRNGIDIVGDICPAYEYWELSRELSILKVSDEVLFRPFNTLSNGEQTKIMLAAMFLNENSFLLIDEPTNHLDIEGRQLVSDYLKNKSGFILISHDRAFLDNCIDHIIAINKTNIEVKKGDFSTWLHNKALEDNFEISENEKLKKDIKRLSKAAKRSSDWSDKTAKSKFGVKNSGSSIDRGFVGHKAAKMMKSAKNLESRQSSAIDEKAKLLKNVETAEKLKINQFDFHTNKLVDIENLSVFYDNKPVCKGISFTIEKGDRIVLKGKNGSGKSSILKLICGEKIDCTGNILINSQLKISYVSQNTGFLKGNLIDFAKENDIEDSLFKAILRKLDFSRTQFEKNIEDFSGGQKKKVLIAKSLCEKAHLHIWDEPLNFIDVISRMQIEQLLLENKPTILFVEHDSAFCENVATKYVEVN